MGTGARGGIGNFGKIGLGARSRHIAKTGADIFLHNRLTKHFAISHTNHTLISWPPLLIFTHHPNETILQIANKCLELPLNGLEVVQSSRVQHFSSVECNDHFQNRAPDTTRLHLVTTMPPRACEPLAVIELQPCA